MSRHHLGRARPVATVGPDMPRARPRAHRKLFGQAVHPRRQMFADDPIDGIGTDCRLEAQALGNRDQKRAAIHLMQRGRRPHHGIELGIGKAERLRIDRRYECVPMLEDRFHVS